MSEGDVITLLAAANPIRVDDLADMDLVVFDRRPTKRILVLAAVVLLAGAAALIGVFAVPSPSPQHPVTTLPSAGERAAAEVPVDQALAEASKSFGVPVVLPDTPLLKPSEADPNASIQWLPSPQPGVKEPVSQLDVQFSTSTPFVTIEYAPTDLTPCGPTNAPCSTVYPKALDQYNAEIAQTPTHPVDGRTPPTFQIVKLTDGTPALIATDSRGNDIQFRVGPLSINIWAPSNDGVPTSVHASDLQAFAQSILDRSK